MNLRFLLRMAKWAHRPPGEKQVVFVLGIVAFCLLLFAVERLIGGWPEALAPAWDGRTPTVR